MFCIKSLQLNHFVYTLIPCARALYEKFGFSSPQFESRQTGDDVTIPVNITGTKTQTLELGRMIIEKRGEFERNPDAKPLGDVKPNEV